MKDRYETTVLSSEQISKILPHRYPFLLVDRVVEFEAGKNNFSRQSVRHECLSVLRNNSSSATSTNLFSIVQFCMYCTFTAPIER